MSRLKRKTKLTIERHTGGERDANNKYYDFPPEYIEAVFSIQPFQKGSEQLILPDGIRASDAYVLYGTTPIKEVDNDSTPKTKADKVTIEGKSYVAHNVANWSFHGSRADHYESVFIKEEKLSQRS